VTVDELWLQSFQKLAAYIAHDLKGALNGVSVNLEVVRSRAEREGTPASDVQRYSRSACDQLAVVIRATTSLLTAGRASKGPAELTAVARNLVGLVIDTAGNEGARIDLDVEGGLPAETSASANAIRLAVGEALLAAISAKQPITIRVRSHPEPAIRIEPVSLDSLPADVIAALSDAKIEIHTAGHGISIAFPAPANHPEEA
jgi:signal transduction histidine kinase